MPALLLLVSVLGRFASSACVCVALGDWVCVGDEDQRGGGLRLECPTAHKVLLVSFGLLFPSEQPENANLFHSIAVRGSSTKGGVMAGADPCNGVRSQRLNR